MPTTACWCRRPAAPRRGWRDSRRRQERGAVTRAGAASEAELPFSRHPGMVRIGRESGDDDMSERIVRVLQIAGAALAIPAAAGGTYSAYQTYFSSTAGCERLKT